jgi:N-methylhydantoinase A
MEVGPRSSGADPGPICYGQGGTEPTVTDALLLLGFLDPETFFGGRMKLAAEETERVFREKLADPTDQSLTDAAWSAYEIVCENMATAFRQHASSKGVDPRAQSLVATGGAGPSHAYRVAEKVGIDEILCPAGAGVASSVGLMMAPRSYEVTSTNRRALGALDADEMAAEFETLLEEARDVLSEAGADGSDLVVEASLDMRHVDQGEEMKVELPDTDVRDVTPELARDRFGETYRRRFDRDVLDHPIEVINFRVNLRERRETQTADRFGDGVETTDTARTRDAYFGRDAGFVDATIRDWGGLSPGERLAGPAVVEADHTTVVVGPDWDASVAENMDIHMERSER